MRKHAVLLFSTFLLMVLILSVAQGEATMHRFWGIPPSISPAEVRDLVFEKTGVFMEPRELWAGYFAYSTAQPTTMLGAPVVLNATFEQDTLQLRLNVSMPVVAFSVA